MGGLEKWRQKQLLIRVTEEIVEVGFAFTGRIRERWSELIQGAME
jgi:hypothetical protein